MGPRSRLIVSLLITFTFASSGLVGCAAKPGRGKAKSVSARRAARTPEEKCREAAEQREILTLGWDTAMAARFETRAKEGVVAVVYTGCALEVLDACKGTFGTYDTNAPKGILPTDYARPLKDGSSAWDWLPLGMDQAKIEVGNGDAATLTYKLLSGNTATGNRPAKIPLSKIAGCEKVTHFVTGISRGAAAIELTKGTEKRVGPQVGSLAACGATGTDGGSCKEPVRLFLTAVPATDRADESAAEALLKSADAKQKAEDGKGCLADLDARAAIAPEDQFTRNVRAGCLMFAGECEKGIALYTAVRRDAGDGEVSAAKDARDLANMRCGSASATNPSDLATRLQREALALAKKGDGKGCVGAFDALEAALAKLPPAEAAEKDKLGSFVGMNLAACAGTISCDEGYALYKRFLQRALRTTGSTAPARLSGDKVDRPRYDELLKKQNVVCK